MRRRAAPAIVALVAALIGAPAGNAYADGQEPPAVPLEATPPSSFEIHAESAPVAVEAMVPGALPLRLTPAVGISSVEVSTTPVVVALAGPVFSPVAETAAGERPAWCYANYPGEASESSCGGAEEAEGYGRMELGSGQVRANGHPSDRGELRGEASASVHRLEPVEDSPWPLTLASAASAARGGADPDDREAITAGASSRLQGIEIADALEIAEIRSQVTGALDGRPGGLAHDHDFAVVGAEVGDVPVRITADGVVVDEDEVTGGGLGEASGGLQEGVNAALEAAGIRVRLIAPDEEVVGEHGEELVLRSGGIGVQFVAPEEAGEAPGGAALIGTRADLILGRSELVMSAFRPLAVEAVALPEGEPHGERGGHGEPEQEPVASRAAAASDGPGGGARGSGPANADGAERSAASDPQTAAAPGASGAGTADGRDGRAAPDPPSPGGAGADELAAPATVPTGEQLERGWEAVFPIFALLVLALPALAVLSRATLPRRSGR